MMELDIIEKKKNTLSILVKDEDHTLCNAIKDELNKASSVKAAGYNVDHPLTGNPKLTVETSSGTPVKSIGDAAKVMKKNNEKFLKDIKKF